MRLAANVLLWCLAFVAGSAWAVDEKDLLPVDEAFALTAAPSGDDAIRVEWKIAPGYYLYRHRTSVKALDAAVELGKLELPTGQRKRDEFFGDVETYRGVLSARQVVNRAPAGTPFQIEVRYQGCADIGVCYPPERRVLTIAMPGQTPAPSTNAQPPSMPGSNPGQASLGFAGPGSTLEAGPLPEEQAFRVDALVEPGSTVANLRAAVRFTMPPGYYLYRDQTKFELVDPGSDVSIDAPVFPPGRSYRDEHFGDVIVYFDQVEVGVPLRGSLAGVTSLPIKVSFQGCQDGGICYPPMERIVVLPIAAALGRSDGGKIQSPRTGEPSPPTHTPAFARSAQALIGARTSGPQAPLFTPVGEGSIAGAPALAEDSRLAQSLLGENRTLALLSFFVFGLLLAFTPCVLPMIPILSGIIAGAGPNLSTRRAVLLSSVYVLASAVVFMFAGIAAGLAGANLQAAFQQPWVLILFAAVFVALALSMFGLYELQLPASLQTRLANVSNRQRPGSLGGVAMMGALSALIVGPCVAPPLAGAVLYISQTRDAVFGGLALFLLALGMGAPLVAFGATAGRLMPRAGLWMDAVKAAFGVVFLLLAVWMLERILPPAATLFLFGAVLIGAGVAMRALDPLSPAAGGWMRVWKAVGVLLLLLGIAQLVGALSGARDYLRPLGALGGGTVQAAHVEFRKIRSVADLERELAAAAAADRPLMLDFYADWCIACKEMDKYTFTDAAVIAAADAFVRIKADVTANDATDKALLKHLELIGPPVTLFYAKGVERRELRLIGFEKPGPFRARLERARAVDP